MLKLGPGQPVIKKPTMGDYLKVAELQEKRLAAKAKKEKKQKEKNKVEEVTLDSPSSAEENNNDVEWLPKEIPERNRRKKSLANRKKDLVEATQMRQESEEDAEIEEESGESNVKQKKKERGPYCQYSQKAMEDAVKEINQVRKEWFDKKAAEMDDGEIPEKLPKEDQLSFFGYQTIATKYVVPVQTLWEHVNKDLRRVAGA